MSDECIDTPGCNCPLCVERRANPPYYVWSPTADQFLKLLQEQHDLIEAEIRKRPPGGYVTWKAYVRRLARLPVRIAQAAYTEARAEWRSIHGNYHSERS